MDEGRSQELTPEDEEHGVDVGHEVVPAAVCTCPPTSSALIAASFDQVMHAEGCHVEVSPKGVEEEEGVEVGKGFVGLCQDEACVHSGLKAESSHAEEVPDEDPCGGSQTMSPQASAFIMAISSSVHGRLVGFEPVPSGIARTAL